MEKFQWPFLNNNRNLYWKGISYQARNEAISEIQDTINQYGFITDYHMFSDLEMSFIIEIREDHIQGLHGALSSILHLEDGDVPNIEPAAERKILLNVTFVKSTGNLRIQVPDVPG